MNRDERFKAPQSSFAAVILAAGSPKKGRHYLGKTLVEHAVQTAIAAGAKEVVVVTAENPDQVRHDLRRLPVRVIQNRNPEEGISSSIRLGISSLKTNPQAAVLCLCDQPKITPDHLRTLAERALDPDGPQIVASCYDGVSGAPAAFKQSVFPDLLALKGKEGARSLIRSAGLLVEAIQFSDANQELEPAKCSDPPEWPRRQQVFNARYDRSREPRAPPQKRRPALAVL